MTEEERALGLAVLSSNIAVRSSVMGTRSAMMAILKVVANDTGAAMEYIEAALAQLADAENYARESEKKVKPLFGLSNES